MPGAASNLHFTRKLILCGQGHGQRSCWNEVPVFPSLSCKRAHLAVEIENEEQFGLSYCAQDAFGFEQGSHHFCCCLVKRLIAFISIPRSAQSSLLIIGSREPRFLYSFPLEGSARNLVWNTRWASSTLGNVRARKRSACGECVLFHYVTQCVVGAITNTRWPRAKSTQPASKFGRQMWNRESFCKVAPPLDRCTL